MSKIKLAMDVVSDLKSLAESIETLVKGMEANESLTTKEIADEEVKKKLNAKAKSEKTEVEKEEIKETKTRAIGCSIKV